MALLVILPLLLSACGNRPNGPVSIAQNGSLYDVGEPQTDSEISDYVRHTNSEEILSYLGNSEPFILYVGMPGCLGCNMFKPNLLQYVNQTKALVHYLNYANSGDRLEYSKIWVDYRDIFMADIEVPYLMIIENAKSYAKGAVSKMTAATADPFLNMMNSLVKVSKVNSHVEYDSANYYLNNNQEGLYFFYDRNDEDAQEIYSSLIWPRASLSEKHIQVVDYANFNDLEKMALCETFSLDEDIGPIAKYYRDGTVVGANFFGIDENVDQQFLDAYL